jgi:hypothetical protein
VLTKRCRRPRRGAGAGPGLSAVWAAIVPFAPLHGGLLAGMQVLEREFVGDVRFAGSGFSEAELDRPHG